MKLLAIAGGRRGARKRHTGNPMGYDLRNGEPKLEGLRGERFSSAAA